MFRSLFCLITIVLFCSCGVKGKPLPPEKPREIGIGKPQYKGVDKEMNKGQDEDEEDGEEKKQ